jgi:hypothetical protein
MLGPVESPDMLVPILVRRAAPPTTP